MNEQSTKPPFEGPSSAKPSKSSAPEIYLLEENMISVSTHLDLDQIQHMERENASLTKQFNQTQCELRKKLQQKQALERTLENLRQANLVHNASATNKNALQETRSRCADYERKIAVADLDARVLSNLLHRTRGFVDILNIRIGKTRGELARTDELHSLTNKARNEGVRRSKTEMEQNLKDSGVEDAQLRLETAKRDYKTLLEMIANIKIRTESIEKEGEYRKLREGRLLHTVRRLRERKEYFAQVGHKLRRYYDEFKLQHRKLTEVFMVEKKEEIDERKEHRDIQQQSEKNDYNERVTQLQRMSEIHCGLEEQLEWLKAHSTLTNDERVKLQRIYDKGEYNMNSASSGYVTHKMELRGVKSALEEKLGFVRTVNSGIKHVLFKLRECDQGNETGSWYDLTIIAAIDDISIPETRPKFSKLLMILEQKIVCLCTLIVQKVRHMAVYVGDIAVTPEEAAERPALEISFVPESSVKECSRALRRCLDSVGIVKTLAKNSTDQLSPHVSTHRGAEGGFPASEEEEFNRPFTGTEVPRIAARSPKRARDVALTLDTASISATGKNNPNPSLTYQIQKSDKLELDSAQRALTNLDMMVVNENVLELMFPRKNRTEKAGLPQTLAETKELEAALREQTDSKLSFNKERAKVKLLVKELKKRHEAGKKPGKGTVPQRKSKKRVTNLTNSIANAMKKRPAALVDIAKTTFDAMEKLKRGSDVRSLKEVESNPTLMPNFLNAILSVKRSRGGEDISQIASRCTYFTNTPAKFLNKGLGRLARPKADPMAGGNLLENTKTILHRLANVTSLNKMESVRPGFSTTFEKEYYYGKKSSALPEIQTKDKRRSHGRNATMGLSKYNTSNVMQNGESAGNHMVTLGTFAGDDKKETRNCGVYGVLSSVSLALFPSNKAIIK